RGKPKLPRRRAKPAFPIPAVILLALLSAGIGWWTVDPELPDRISKYVDIRMTGLAEAADTGTPAKSAATKAETKANAAGPAAGPKAQGEAKGAIADEEELSH